MIRLNGEPINVTRFPDNTTQVWKLSETAISGYPEAIIDWEYSYEGELIELAQLKDLLESYGTTRFILRIDYLPFARQDKEVTNNATFALRSFAKLLNSIEFDEVYITDPHSAIATDLINNSVASYPIGKIIEAIKETKADLICYPDAGAVKKYSTKFRILGQEYIYGNKVRDQETGHILSYEIVAAFPVQDQRILVVDDICDGGKTFEILAKDLYKAGAKDVNLFVTHGLFTRGLRSLYDSGINRFFTAKGEVVLMMDGGHGYK